MLGFKNTDPLCVQLQCALQLRDWVAKDAEGMPHQAGTVFTVFINVMLRNGIPLNVPLMGCLALFAPAVSFRSILHLRFLYLWFQTESIKK